MNADAEVLEPSAEVLEEVRGGDHDATRTVVEYLYPIVIKHVSLLLRFDSLAEDAAQESMLAIYRGLPKFRGDASIKVWALKIASRVAFRVAKRERKKRASNVVLDVELGAFDLDQRDSAELVFLGKQLQALSPKKRVAFVLIALEGFSAAEAASIIGVSANTAASRYRHARLELERLKKKHESFDDSGGDQRTKEPAVGPAK